MEDEMNAKINLNSYGYDYNTSQFKSISMVENLIQEFDTSMGDFVTVQHILTKIYRVFSNKEQLFNYIENQSHPAYWEIVNPYKKNKLYFDIDHAKVDFKTFNK